MKQHDRVIIVGAYGDSHHVAAQVTGFRDDYVLMAIPVTGLCNCVMAKRDSIQYVMHGSHRPYAQEWGDTHIVFSKDVQPDEQSTREVIQRWSSGNPLLDIESIVDNLRRDW